jgi:hypothetical protein
MAPAIGNLLVDIQYPTCEPHEKITTQPCLEKRTALGQRHDASSNLPKRRFDEFRDNVFTDQERELVRLPAIASESPGQIPLHTIPRV